MKDFNQIPGIRKCPVFITIVGSDNYKILKYLDSDDINIPDNLGSIIIDENDFYSIYDIKTFTSENVYGCIIYYVKRLSDNLFVKIGDASYSYIGPEIEHAFSEFNDSHFKYNKPHRSTERFLNRQLRNFKSRLKQDAKKDELNDIISRKEYEEVKKLLSNPVINVQGYSSWDRNQRWKIDYKGEIIYEYKTLGPENIKTTFRLSLSPKDKETLDEENLEGFQQDAELVFENTLRSVYEFYQKSGCKKINIPLTRYDFACINEYAFVCGKPKGEWTKFGDVLNRTITAKFEEFELHMFQSDWRAGIPFCVKE